MEVAIDTTPKQLHKHTLPIMLLALGLFVATIYGVANTYGTNSNLGLAMQSFHNGIFSSNRYTAGVLKLTSTNQTIAQLSQQAQQPTLTLGNGNANNIGQSVPLRTTLYSVKP